MDKCWVIYFIIGFCTIAARGQADGQFPDYWQDENDAVPIEEVPKSDQNLSDDIQADEMNADEIIIGGELVEENDDKYSINEAFQENGNDDTILNYDDNKNEQIDGIANGDVNLNEEPENVVNSDEAKVREEIESFRKELAGEGDVEENIENEEDVEGNLSDYQFEDNRSEVKEDVRNPVPADSDGSVEYYEAEQNFEEPKNMDFLNANNEDKAYEVPLNAVESNLNIVEEKGPIDDGTNEFNVEENNQDEIQLDTQQVVDENGQHMKKDNDNDSNTLDKENQVLDKIQQIIDESDQSVEEKNDASVNDRVESDLDAWIDNETNLSADKNQEIDHETNESLQDNAGEVEKDDQILEGNGDESVAKDDDNDKTLDDIKQLIDETNALCEDCKGADANDYEANSEEAEKEVQDNVDYEEVQAGVPDYIDGIQEDEIQKFLVEKDNQEEHDTFDEQNLRDINDQPESDESELESIEDQKDAEEDEDTVDKVKADLNEDLQRLFDTWNKLAQDSGENPKNEEELSAGDVAAYENKYEKPFGEDTILAQRVIEDYDSDKVESEDINVGFESDLRDIVAQEDGDIALVEIQEQNIVHNNPETSNEEANVDGNDTKIINDNLPEESKDFIAGASIFVENRDDDVVQNKNPEKISLDIEKTPEVNNKDVEKLIEARYFNLTSSQYDELMKQFAIVYADDIKTEIGQWANNIKINATKALTLTSPNYPEPYFTDQLLDMHFSGEGVGIELNVTDLDLNGAVGDFLLVKTDPAASEGLILSYHIPEPRTYRFMGTNDLFLRFGAMKTSVRHKGYSFSVRMIEAGETSNEDKQSNDTNNKITEIQDDDIYSSNKLINQQIQEAEENDETKYLEEIKPNSAKTQNQAEAMDVMKLTSSQYDDLMRQFAIVYADNIQTDNIDNWVRVINIDHIDAVNVTSPNYPDAYPTDITIDYHISGEGVGIEFNVTSLDLNGAVGDYLLIKSGDPDAAASEGLIFSYHLTEPRTYRFLDVDQLFVRFRAMKSLLGRNGFSFSVKMVEPPKNDTDSVPSPAPLLPPPETLTVFLGGLTVSDFMKIMEEFRVIVADMATMYINTQGIQAGVNTTSEVTQITNVGYCNVKWPSFDVCVQVSFGVPLSLEFEDDEESKLTEDELYEMWTRYFYTDPFAYRLRQLNIQEFSTPNERVVLRSWLVVSSGVVLAAAMLAFMLWRFSCFQGYTRMSPFSDTDSIRDEKRNLDLYPTPHQTLPPLYSNEYKWVEDDATRVDMGGFANRNYNRDDLFDIDSDDETVNAPRDRYTSDV